MSREAVITFKPEKAMEGWVLLIPVKAGGRKEGCPSGDGESPERKRSLEEISCSHLKLSRRFLSLVPPMASSMGHAVHKGRFLGL